MCNDSSAINILAAIKFNIVYYNKRVKTIHIKWLLTNYLLSNSPVSLIVALYLNHYISFSAVWMRYASVARNTTIQESWLEATCMTPFTSSKCAINPDTRSCLPAIINCYNIDVPNIYVHNLQNIILLNILVFNLLFGIYSL